jgi:uncharacterized membrane protein YgcG
MRNLDFTSLQSLVTTVVGLAAAAFVMVGIRLLVMQTVQQRRERENRQINDRLRTLIAAYKTLGGSFTGDLTVDPTHLRDLMRRPPPTTDGEAAGAGDVPLNSSDRSRRIRDAVEAALSDVILLGTEEQVRLAAQAASDLVAGRPTHTAELVVSTELAIPRQGPTRPVAAGSGSGKGKGDDGEKGGGGKGGGGGMGGMAGGAGMGLGGGMALDSEREEGR